MALVRSLYATRFGQLHMRSKEGKGARAAAHSWREAIGVVFGPPGWRPNGQGLTSQNIRSNWESEHLAR